MQSTRLFTILIFLFIFLLPFAPESDYQVATLSYDNIVSEVNHRQFGIPFLTLSNLILVPLTIMFFLKLKRSFFGFYRFELYLLIFVFLSLFSGLLSISYASSLVWFLKVFYCLFVYFLFSRINISQKQLMIIVMAFLGIEIIQAILAFIQFVSGKFIGLPFEFIRAYFPNKVQDSYLRVVGTFAHPNKLSAVNAMLIPFSFIFFVKNPNKKFKFLLLPVLFLIVPLMALSRWGFLTTLFAFFTTMILIHIFIAKLSLNLFSKNLKYFLVIFLLLFGLLLNSAVYERFTTTALSGDTSLNGRVFLIGYSLNMLKENPFFGVGPGSFTTYFANFDYSESKISTRFLAPVHNTFLLISSENGIIAAIFFGLFLIGIIVLFFSRIKKLDKNLKIFAVIFLVSSLVFIFNGLWELRTLTDRTAILFFIMLGLLANILRSPIAKFS